jgi:DNA polymerase I-like protein with 3'-5' exonuclease and polymerase domains
MIVLDYPTKSDDKWGNSPSGDVDLKLKYFLEKAGISYSDVYITNALKCYVAKEDVSKIKKVHIEACAEYLSGEIEKFRPKAIIVCGKTAFRMISGHTSVDEFVEHDYDLSLTVPASDSDDDDVKTIERTFKCFPAYSIYSSLFMWENNASIIRSLKKAKLFVEKGIVEKTPDPKVNLILTLEALKEFEERIVTKKLVATDFETTGLTFWKDKIINSGYCGEDDVVDVLFHIPYQKKHIQKWPEEEVELARKINRFIKEHGTEIHACLKRVHASKIRWSLHNAKFDLKFANFHNIPFKHLYWDTLVADPLIEENEGHSLNEVYVRRGINYGPYDVELYPYVGKHADEKDKKEGSKKTYQYIPPSIIIKYLGYDCAGLRKVQKLNVMELKACGMYEHFLEVKMPSLKLLLDIEIRGVRYDKEMLIKSSKVLMATEKAFLDELIKMTGDKSFNPNSDMQISRYMVKEKYPFKKMEVPSTSRGYSTKAEHLKKFLSIPKCHDFVKTVMAVKKITKVKGTYLDGKDSNGGMLQYITSDNMLHPNFNAWSPKTGRYSCLDLETEILTLNGWKKYNEITYDDQAFEYEHETRSLVPRKPKWIYLSEEEDRKMVSFNSKTIDMKLSDDHKVILETSNGVSRVSTAIEADKGNNLKLIRSGVYDGSSVLNVKSEKVKLLVAIISDGSYQRNQIRFTFKKERKISRLKAICDSIGLTLKELSPQGTSRTFVIKKDLKMFKGCLDDSKNPTYAVLNLSKENRLLMIEEMRWWDGDSSLETRIEFASANKSINDVYDALASTVGYRSISCVYKSPTGHQDINKTLITRSDSTKFNNVKKTVTNEKCRVWCIETESGFFLARRNGKTFVTGNCSSPSLQVFPRPIKGLLNTRQFVMKTNPDDIMFEADFTALEQYVVAALAKDTILIQKILDGTDIHSFNAVTLGKALNWIDQNITYAEFVEKCGKGVTKKEDIDKDIYMLFDGLRTKAKTVGFGLNYGKGAESFAKEFGITAMEAEEMIDAYFGLYKAMKKWRDKTVETALKKGEIHLLSGRARRFHMATEWINSSWAKKSWSAKIIKEGIARQAMNFPIQGGAHEAFEQGCLRLMTKIKTDKNYAHLQLSMHDGIVGSCKPQDKELIEKLIKEEMVMTFNKDTPHELTLKIDVGFYEDRWYGQAI